MTEIKKQPYRKIVVPIDGSGWADRAIPHAARIAKNNGAELILLHIYHSPLAQYRDSVALAQQQGLVDQEREQIKQHIISLRTDLRNEGVTVRGHMIDGRDPAFQICRYVQAEGADLVVMCSHGRTGLARFLFGSVAQKVMQRLDVPVLLIRPDSPAETDVDDSDMPKGEDIL